MPQQKRKRFVYNLNRFNIVPQRKIDGRWTLIRFIGGGGNGVVWQCRDVDGREYAIKMLKHAYKEPYARFYDEVAFMELFGDIPGVLPVIAKNIPEGRTQYDDTKVPYYYVMPLATSLGRSIYQESIENKISIIKSLLEMMVNLHNRGIAHRDIKPANILFYNGQYVLSDFGLVFFQGKSMKTPPGVAGLGAKWTRSPQMERDASSADKYKSDVYSMAKTIWMIFSGDFTSFEGQYNPASSILSLAKHLPGKYITPLDNILVRCTDHLEEGRPTAREMLDWFNEWDDINHNWGKANLLQWVEINHKIFPLHEPDHAEWVDLGRMVGIINILGTYESLNHLFFPNNGGLDLTGARLSRDPQSIELEFGGLVLEAQPEKLVYERISEDFQWSYFRLELKGIEPQFKQFVVDPYMEEYGEITRADGTVEAIPLREYDDLDKNEIAQLKARHMVRYLKGALVVFHKNSLYNQLVSKYRGEHEKMSAEEFKRQITVLSQKFKGKTMEDFIKK